MYVFKTLVQTQVIVILVFFYVFYLNIFIHLGVPRVYLRNCTHTKWRITDETDDGRNGNVRPD